MQHKRSKSNPKAISAAQLNSKLYLEKYKESI